MGYLSIRNYLGVRAEELENESPIPTDRLPQLEHLMRWLFGCKSEGIEPRIRRQNPDLRHLARALQVPQGVDLLKDGYPLSVALDASLGDAHLFRTALTRAETSAKESMRFVSTGFKGEEDLVETGEKLLRLSKSLHHNMTNYEP